MSEERSVARVTRSAQGGRHRLGGHGWHGTPLGGQCFLLRHIAWRDAGRVAEQELFHLFRDDHLRLFLEWQQAVLVQNHFHPLFPHLPGLARDVVVDPLTERTRPRRSVETRQVTAEFETVDGPAARI